MPTARSTWKPPGEGYYSTNDYHAAQIAAIENVIRDYHTALDNRQHGDVAAHNALSAIEAIMGMYWSLASARLSLEGHKLGEE